MQNLKHVASLYSWAGQFEYHLVKIPEGRFSQVILLQNFLKNDVLRKVSKNIIYRKHVGGGIIRTSSMWYSFSSP